MAVHRLSDGQSLRAVLLDAHGTLLRLDPPAPALRRLVSERFGVQLTVAQAERAIAAEIAYYRAHLDEGRDAASVDALRGRCSDVLREALAAEHLLGEVGADEFTRTLLDSLQFHPYPEVEPVLVELRRRSLRLVVASNWDASLSQTLDTLGLLDLLDGVVTSAQAGAPKPHGAVFRQALKLAGANPEQALHVGDSLEEDFTGARQASLAALLIVRDGRSAPPGIPSVASLEELLAMPELQP